LTTASWARLVSPCKPVVRPSRVGNVRRAAVIADVVLAVAARVPGCVGTCAARSSATRGTLTTDERTLRRASWTLITTRPRDGASTRLGRLGDRREGRMGRRGMALSRRQRAAGSRAKDGNVFRCVPKSLVVTSRLALRRPSATRRPLRSTRRQRARRPYARRPATGHAAATPGVGFHDVPLEPQEASRKP
jgi:hypothetical protein